MLNSSFFSSARPECAFELIPNSKKWYSDNVRSFQICLRPPAANAIISQNSAVTTNEEERSNLNAVEARPWLSINHFAPFTEQEVIEISDGLKALGWDVKGSEDGFDVVPAAKGILAIRYSDPQFQMAAKAIASDLLEMIGTEQEIQISDLSQGKWADKDNPEHIEVWLGKK